MRKTERLRETLSTPLTAADIDKKWNEGWRMVSVEWERESETARAAEPLTEEVPFGLQVGDDCRHLQENIAEKQVLILIMEMIVQDKKLSQIADELNQRRYRTRQGMSWNPATVFNLLPRLIEVGPRIFTSDEWVARRQHLFKVV
ncbi:MAG: recombinase family protein [Bryobacteraceae bacterium]